MPVLHGGVAHVAELCLPSGGFAVEPTIGITRTCMGVALALLAVEVRAVVTIAAILGAEARPEDGSKAWS